MEASPASPLNGCPCPHVSISNSSRSRGENDNVLYHVRRAKARFSSGCKSRPATFVPAGSNRSSCGGNETAEASGVEGHESDLVSMQANANRSPLRVCFRIKQNSCCPALSPLTLPSVTRSHFRFQHQRQWARKSSSPRTPPPL